LVAGKGNNQKMVEAMNRVPGLRAKGHSYFFRLRIPGPLQATYGRSEVSEALGRLSYPQATVKALELSAHYVARFNGQLQELGIEPTTQRPPAAPAPKVASMVEVIHIAKEGARLLLEQDESARSLGGHTDAYEAWATLLSDLDNEVTQALSGASMGPLFQRFESDLHSHGVKAPTDRVKLRAMVYKWATTYGKALQQVQQRVKGEPVETPAPLEAPASLTAHLRRKETDPAKKAASELKLLDVFTLWRDHETDRPPKTVAKVVLAVKRFEVSTGNPSMGELTKAGGAEYRKGLMGEVSSGAMSSHAAGAQLLWVNILLNFEVNRYGRMAVNPWKNLSIIDNSEATRDEWTDPQVVQLFSHPLFQSYELPSPKNAGKDAAYWCPVIGAYTGARVTEIAQLLVSDIAEVDGLPCIRFAVTEPGWQRLKGGPEGPSKRTIPMHPELLRLGLVDYARATGSQGHARLFPDLFVSTNNNAGGSVSGWFSKFKTEAGFGAANTFHGWRNTVETKLHRGRESQIHIDRYVGHRPEGMGPAKYSKLKPADFVETAAMISYAGLVLPRVYGSACA
jgi:integrase